MDLLSWRFESECHEIDDLEDAFDPDVTLGKPTLEQGQTLVFLFDFGDSWEFNIEVQDRRAGEWTKTAHVFARGNLGTRRVGRCGQSRPVHQNGVRGVCRGIKHALASR